MESIKEDLYLEPVLVTQDDVNQEYELALLNGIENPSKAIIRKKLLTSTRELFYGTIPEWMEISYPWANDNSLERASHSLELLEWSFRQSEEVQIVIRTFLFDARMEKVNLIIEELKGLGIKMTEEKTKTNKPKTTTSVLMDALPMDKDEITELVQQLNPSVKRPAMSARQFIRRKTSEGLITKGGDGKYHKRTLTVEGKPLRELLETKDVGNG